jgi:hypothetical protein
MEKQGRAEQNPHDEDRFGQHLTAELADHTVPLHVERSRNQSTHAQHPIKEHGHRQRTPRPALEERHAEIMVKGCQGK